MLVNKRSLSNRSRRPVPSRFPLRAQLIVVVYIVAVIMIFSYLERIQSEMCSKSELGRSRGSIGLFRALSGQVVYRFRKPPSVAVN